MKKPESVHPCGRKRVVAVIGAIVFFALLGGGVSYTITKNYYQNILAQIHPLFVKSSPYKLLHPMVGLVLPSDLSSSLDTIHNGIQSIACPLNHQEP